LIQVGSRRVSTSQEIAFFLDIAGI
jgi:hypothetical protein